MHFVSPDDSSLALFLLQLTTDLKLPDGDPKSKRAKDMNILVLQREAVGITASRSTLIHRMKNQGSGRIRQQIETKQGTFDFVTSASEGPLDVCIQVYSATRQQPARVALQVTTKRAVSAVAPSDASSPFNNDVDRLNAHSSLITEDMKRMGLRLKEIGSNANYAKEREKEFHGKSVDLNKAVKYWPMFRVLVLVLSAYIQVNHVVTYMKSRRIC